MKATFGGVVLVSVVPDLVAAIAARFDPAEVLHFEAQTPSHNLWHLPIPHIPPLPEVFPGRLCWPADASRFATFFAVVDDVDLTTIGTLFGENGPQSATLQFTPDVTGEIEPLSVTMYPLPPRPLLQVPGQNGLWLLPLVDQRYFWQMQCGDFGATSWSALISQVGTALGISISTSNIPGAYGQPSSRFTVYRQPVSLFLDAVARTIGQRVVVGFDGTVKLQNWTDANASQLVDLALINTSPLTRADAICSGGTFGDITVAEVVPSAVVVASLQSESSGQFNTAPFLVTETLVSLAIPQYQQAGEVFDASNSNPTVITSFLHGLSTGNSTTISGALGNTAINGTWVVTVLNANQFTIPVDTSAGGIYTGGGVFTVTINGYSGTKTLIGDMAATYPGTTTLTIGTQSSGTFSLKFTNNNGSTQTTPPLDYTVGAVDIQAALAALSNIGGGNVTVTGSGPFTITFASSLAGSSNPLVANFISLSNPSNASIVTAPSNTTALTAYAVQAATDWYLWRLQDADIQFDGVVAWTPNGAIDLIEIWILANRFSTRVSRAAYDELTLGLTQSLGYYQQPLVTVEDGQISDIPVNAVSGINILQLLYGTFTSPARGTAVFTPQPAGVKVFTATTTALSSIITAVSGTPGVFPLVLGATVISPNLATTCTITAVNPAAFTITVSGVAQTNGGTTLTVINPGIVSASFPLKPQAMGVGEKDFDSIAIYAETSDRSQTNANDVVVAGSGQNVCNLKFGSRVGAKLNQTYLGGGNFGSPGYNLGQDTTSPLGNPNNPGNPNFLKTLAATGSGGVYQNTAALAPWIGVAGGNSETFAYLSSSGNVSGGQDGSVLNLDHRTIVSSGGDVKQGGSYNFFPQGMWFGALSEGVPGVSAGAYNALLGYGPNGSQNITNIPFTGQNTIYTEGFAQNNVQPYPWYPQLSGGGYIGFSSMVNASGSIGLIVPGMTLHDGAGMAAGNGVPVGSCFYIWRTGAMKQGIDTTIAGGAAVYGGIITSSGVTGITGTFGG